MRKQEWMPEGTWQQIQLHKHALKRAQKYVGELHAELGNWMRKLQEQAQMQLMGQSGQTVSFDLENGWECDESPIGVCVYEGFDEWCMFCGDPDERK